MNEKNGRRSLQVWGGVEPIRTQAGAPQASRHGRNTVFGRPRIVEQLASLGISALRVPVLWSHVAPTQPDHLDWHDVDEGLTRLSQYHVEPVVGLLRGSSAPSYTDVAADEFADRFAAYARAVAERYPWVDSYAPIDPTAVSISALGDEAALLRQVVNQAKATSLAMREIRRVNPIARLIQTAEVGQIRSTEPLREQARTINDRQWLVFDLLLGMVDRHHPQWDALVRSGIQPDELGWFKDQACPPDTVGLHYSLESDRFIDHRIDRYALETSLARDGHVFVDLPAHLVVAEGIGGVYPLLQEAWERYSIPTAIAHTFLAASRDEQMRWAHRVWRDVHRARDEGIDVPAVTFGSLLGDWDSSDGTSLADESYWPGAFDLRSAGARPTGLARLIRKFVSGSDLDEPVVMEPGLWERPDSLLYSPVMTLDQEAGRSLPLPPSEESPRPILIVGAPSPLSLALALACYERGLSYHLADVVELDPTNPISIELALSEHQPRAVINALDYERIEDAEADVLGCYRTNTVGPALLAKACDAYGIALLTFSSGLVFDGMKDADYDENDLPNPLNVYGQSRYESEGCVLVSMPTALVVRTGCLFGAPDGSDLLSQALNTVRQNRRFEASDDTLVSPTYMPDLASASLDLLVDGEYGLWHLANAGAWTPAALAKVAVKVAGLDPGQVVARSRAQYGVVQPPNTALTSSRGNLMPRVEDALARYLQGFLLREIGEPQAYIL